METANFMSEYYASELKDFNFNGLRVMDYDKLLLKSVSEAIGNSMPKRFHIALMKKAVGNSPTAVFLDDTGIFARFIYVASSEIVPRRFDRIPIIGLDPTLKHLYQIFGISDKDFANTASIERAIRSLTSHGLPRQVAPEEVVRTLTQGRYVNSPLLQAVALTIMGVDHHKAVDFIANYSSQLPLYSLVSSKHGISLGTESLSGLYLGEDVLPMISTVDVTLSEAELKFLAPAIIYMFIHCHFLYGEPRRIHVVEKSITQTSNFRKEFKSLKRKPDLSQVNNVVDSFYRVLSDYEEDHEERRNYRKIAELIKSKK
jgi:hypothetical protein